MSCSYIAFVQDSAALFAGEVRDPGFTYPRAMGLAILLVVAAEALPVLVQYVLVGWLHTT
jgi:amino acid transporter